MKRISIPSLDEIEEKNNEISKVFKIDLRKSTELSDEKEEKKEEKTGRESGQELPPIEPNLVNVGTTIDKSPIVDNSNDTSKVGIDITGYSKLIISERQKPNPMMKYIRNISYEFFKDILPDFIFGKDYCGLFISLKYHLLHPNYLIGRVNQVKYKFGLIVIICLVDTKDHNLALKSMNKFAINNSCTLILSWSNVEAARYIESYKIYNSKTSDSLKLSNRDKDRFSRFVDCITSIRSVNTTDATTLAANFGIFKNIIKASQEELLLCPGIGEKKVKQMYQVFRKPFTTSAIIERKEQKQLTITTTKRKLSDSKLDKENVDSKKKQKLDREEKEIITISDDEDEKNLM